MNILKKILSIIIFLFFYGVIDAKDFFTDAQFQELKNTNENAIILLLIKQKEKDKEDIKLLKAENDKLKLKKDIISQIKELKKYQESFFIHSDAYKELGQAIIREIQQYLN